MSARFASLAYRESSARRRKLGRWLLALSLAFTACGKSTHHEQREPSAGNAAGSGGSAVSETGGRDSSGAASPGGEPNSAGAAGEGTGGSATGGNAGATVPGATGGSATGGVGTAGSATGTATGGVAGTAMSGAGTTAGGGAGATPVDGFLLRSAPLLFAPTATGFGVSVALAAGDPTALGVRVRKDGAKKYGSLLAPNVRASDLGEFQVDGLKGGTHYDYEVVAQTAQDGEIVLFEGSMTTARAPGDSFTFALVSDTHIGSDLSYSNQGDTTLLDETSAQMGSVDPDFVVNLGDMLDFHEYGFNTPPPDGSITRAAYLNYRATYGDPLGSIPHFAVIGGWDSESGCNTVDEIDRSRTQRLLYLPGPTPDTYAEGGSPFEDYYAFTWGDALFVVLNVYTYTPTCHLLDAYPGSPDDWTLGDAQMQWLRTTLENSTSKWRFLLIHHPVGGNGGDDVDSAYGRGGGRAAHVGEQEIVHELMQQYGVQSFFYGHDHVFTDMVVDNIHYSLPGSAGAIWLFTPDQTGYTTYWANSGWAQVDVTPDNVHVQFLDVTGTTLYDYTLN
jgi:hypothetical protein